MKMTQSNSAWRQFLSFGLAVATSILLVACGGGGGGSATGGTSGGGGTPAVTVNLTSPSTAFVNQAFTLTWTSSNVVASQCDASGGWTGKVATNGSQSITVSAASTVKYTLTCDGVASSANVVVTVPTAPPPAVTIDISPATVIAGQNATVTWSSTNANSCTASGAWSGAKSTSGNQQSIQSTAGTYTYTLSCTGDGGTMSGSATLVVSNSGNNATPIVIDSGPAGAGSVINVPYVTVTICRPGTNVCQTIDHIMLDTGSFGLRIMGSVLSNGLSLPAVTTPSGAEAAECGQFVSGYTWGSVKRADIKIAGEIASSIPIQIMSDTAANFASVPTSCSSIGSNLGTVSAFGSNGVLGVGLFKEDCGSGCAASALAAGYYACVSGVCQPSRMPLVNQVSNPVASFAVNNNGVVMVLPSVTTGGVSSLTGSLIFGVDTQANNAINNETKYTTNSVGNFTTVYKGVSMTSSFIDSGSNGLFFNDSSIAKCTSSIGFYCPPSVASLVATNFSADGLTRGDVNFTIENADRIFGNVAALSLGGGNGAQSGTKSFDWGLPFFFGRRVVVLMDGQTTVHGTGPMWAY